MGPALPGHVVLQPGRRGGQLQRQAFYHRGVLFIAMGAPERAIMDFNMAIRNNPRFRDAYMNRSMMYTLIGRHEDARPDVEQAVALGADRAFLEQEIEDLRIRNGGR